MQATLERPVLRRRRSFAIRSRGIVAPARSRIGGLTGRLRLFLLNTGARLRRPVLYLGSAAAVCHGLWQIWAPLGWFGVAASLLLTESMTGPEDDEA